MEILSSIPLVSAELLANPGSVTFAAATAAATSLYIYFACPQLLVQIYFRIAVRLSGMRLKTVSNEKGFCFAYGERGTKVKGRSSMLLLHGFSADHFMWASIVQKLPDSVHSVALDLPGHGFTSDPDDGEDIGFNGQLERIREFVRLCGLEEEKFHVVGVSMGGALAGLFAARYPHLVCAITMCCPSMKTPIDGEMIEKHKNVWEENGSQMTLDTCPLLPQSGADLQAMLGLVSYRRAYVPQQILQGAVVLRKARNHFYLGLIHRLLSNTGRYALEACLTDIACPVQVLWGQQDEVVHLSGVDVMRAKLQDLRRVDIMPCCGHAVNLDQPKDFALFLAEFWQQLNQS